MEYLEKYGIQLSVFKVMNSMKFRLEVWKSMDFGSFVTIFSSGAKLLYASIFFMQFDGKFIWILLKLNIKIEGFSPKLPGIFLYFQLVTLFYALCLQYAFQMKILVWNFTFFGIKKVWKSMEFDVSVGVWTLLTHSLWRLW